MGNAALRDIAAITETPADTFTDHTFAIDAHHWLYSYMSGLAYWMDEDVYTTADGTEVLNLVAVMRGLPTLLEHDITPIFVFDGTAHTLKADEQAARRAARAEAAADLEAARDAGNEAAVKRLRQRTQQLTDTVLTTTRTLLDHLDVPMVTAPSAGEAQAAHLVRTGEADAVLSDDYDALLFGAPETVRNFSGKGQPEHMRLADTLDTHDLTHEQLVDLAILCGTDYNDGVHGVGPKTGVSGLQTHGDAETFLSARDTTVDELDTLRDIFLSPAVADHSVTATQPDPDFEAVATYTRDEWEIAPDRVTTELDRLRAALD